MTYSHDDFMKESESLLSAFNCDENVITEVQQHLIDVAIFLAENNIKALDSSFVPSHLLNEYDKFAHKMENSPQIKNIFDVMDDDALVNLRELCETLAKDLKHQKIRQHKDTSHEHRKDKLFAEIHETLDKHALPDSVLNLLKMELFELALFMIENRLEYISIEDWPKHLQDDFERFAASFDKVIEENQELEVLNDDTLHSLLHLAELFAATEVTLNHHTFDDLETNYTSDKLKDNIKDFLLKQSLSNSTCDNLINHFEEMASFMHTYHIKEVKLELAPNEKKEYFQTLIEKSHHLQHQHDDLNMKKLDLIHQYLSNIQTNWPMSG